MPVEIERKFLLKNSSWNEKVNSKIEIKQGYLNSNIERTVRVRVSGNKGMIAIKSKTVGLTREEFEYEIPLNDANKLLKLCEKPIIEKTRYKIIHDENCWEIDEFIGVNAGLVIAEIELKTEGEKIKLPTWIGEEVSHNPRYYNANLIENPFSSWS